MVDHGLTIGVPSSLAFPPAGTACLEDWGPTMASTSSSVIILVLALTADSALDSLSSITSSTLYFLPPTSMPPAALTSSSHIFAANLVPSPTLGISPVSGAFIPILMVSGPFGPQATNNSATTKHEMIATVNSLVFIISLLFVIVKQVVRDSSTH